MDAALKAGYKNWNGDGTENFRGVGCFFRGTDGEEWYREEDGFEAHFPPTMEEVEILEAMEESGPPSLGKFGTLFRDFLKENHLSRYNELVRECEMIDLCLDVQEEAEEMLMTLKEQYRKLHPQPNTNEYMKLLQYNNRVQDYAEETVLRDIVYRAR
jgi:hypothetical protein